jgi:hypothetical protein
MTNIYYYPSSSTAIIKDIINNSTSPDQLTSPDQITYNNVTLVTSASAFETSGSEFNATVADIRIMLYSGSILLASFPYGQSNLYVDYAPPTINPTVLIQSDTIISGSNPNSNYYFKVINSSSLEEMFNIGLDIEPSLAGFFIDSGSKYNVTLYSGDSNINNLYVYSGSSLIYSASSSYSASYTLTPTSSVYYQFSASISYDIVS